jgi:hypothetical protein
VWNVVAIDDRQIALMLGIPETFPKRKRTTKARANRVGA